jgi:hypothetical protein
MNDEYTIENVAKRADNEELLEAYARMRYNRLTQWAEIERDFGSLDKFMKRRSAIKAEILKRMKGEIDG